MAFRWIKNRKNTQKNDPEPANGQATSEGEESREQKGFLSRIKKGLKKTREVLTTDIDDLFLGKKGVDDELLEELEELLITSDLGVNTAMEIVEYISRQRLGITGPEDLKKVIKDRLIDLVCPEPGSIPEENLAQKPHTIMVIGVNGVGKTTFIGKIAARYKKMGLNVLIAAADTFRAAAIDQLEIWADRAGASIVKHKEYSDPSAVVFDAAEAAVARNMDVLIIDTAGRLHTKTNLMEELKKIQRTAAKKIPGAPHEILLVLDATTGQNALSQADLFNKAMGITGLVITKLDGTAKGGIAISISLSHKVPIRFIGTGESIEDIEPFDAKSFVEALF